ncbi:hypothetical protein BUALT_Bualt05G0133600 [Buddleja alternifolia]|uniref:Protein MIZU-KUSSEI 1-like n=1 Tax=Buddleja alternifolia TaxID=168488 RepID=A0AAV6XKG3_9LAMI|nr:hypothetical protein BUALT_Bualt05G0133600 [Buddleja alternifolia]
MKKITAKNLHDSLSFSTRYFHSKKKIIQDDIEQISTVEKPDPTDVNAPLQRSLSTGSLKPPPRKKLSLTAVLNKARAHFTSGLGPKLVGTLFGPKHGHVYFAFQENFKQSPLFLIQLATPTSVLVKEMASGLVRIALECEKKKGFKILEEPTIKNYRSRFVESEYPSSRIKLLEEPIWRAHCNGKKCGYAMRRECGPEEWKVLNAIGPSSMGAGVLPGAGGAGLEGEIMYMRAKFERVVGSKDSEAFYMMNPDGNGGGTELSVYLLRI